ncbi:hypothetical protein NL676_020814 [Syzygium grande]|nr:hypothetical protein NL676_020814 [Syzygium grande]
MSCGWTFVSPNPCFQKKKNTAPHQQRSRRSSGAKIVRGREEIGPPSASSIAAVGSRGRNRRLVFVGAGGVASVSAEGGGGGCTAATGGSGGAWLWRLGKGEKMGEEKRRE